MNTCTQCGAAITSDSPEGLCARCLLIAATSPLSGATQKSAPGETIASDGVPPRAAAIDIADADEVARRLPQFEILELLGRGGMGVVYKARQTQLDRIIALKILPPGDALSPGFVERFRREAKSLAKLNHPNIVNVHDFGESNGLYYFVMEFVDGLNLRQMIQGRRMTAAEALAVVPRICDALQFAHEEGVVHRDIKPENILLDKRGRVKIADFGLAKLLGRQETDPRLTQTGASLGTPRYMAPEQMDNPESVDHRADIYSLGVVFYEMLTGELPMGRFAPPSHKVQIDVRLDEIVLHALESDVELRYQHASEVRDAVDEVTSKPGPAAGQQLGLPATSTADTPTRHRFPLLYVLLCTLLFAVAWFTALAFWNLRYPGVVLGGVVMFVAMYAAVSLGRRLFPAMAANWKQQSRFRRALKVIVVLALCVGGYYFVLGGTFAAMERLFWSFQYREGADFEHAYSGKEYELVRQLSEYEKNIPKVELTGGGDWVGGGTGIDAMFCDCGPDFFRFTPSAILCQFAIGSLLLAIGATILTIARRSKTSAGPNPRLTLLPQLGISLTLAAGWCVWVIAWFMSFGSHHGGLTRDAEMISFYPRDPGPFAAGFLGSKFSVNAPLQDIDSVMQEAVKAEGYAASDFYDSGMKTVPQGTYIGSARFFYAWKPSPFDRWHWTRGVLAGSSPSISVEYISTYNPQETVVHITLAQTIGEHFDQEPAISMLKRLVEAAKYGKSTLHPKPLVVAPLSLTPGQSNLRISLPHDSSAFSVAFSADGKILASGSGDRAVQLWSVETGAHLKSITSLDNGGNLVAFSPDGKTLATDASYPSHDILLWNVATGQVIATLHGHTEAIRQLAFSPDGTLLASGARVHQLKLWDLTAGKLKFDLVGHANEVLSVAFNRDGKTLASSSTDETIKLWNVATGKETLTIRHAVGPLAFSPDGKSLAGATNEKLEIWDVITGEKTASFIADGHEVRSVAFNPDGTILASGGWDKSIKLWDPASKKLITKLEGHSGGTICSMAFSPDGKTLASASWDKTVKLWNVGMEKKGDKCGGSEAPLVPQAIAFGGIVLVPLSRYSGRGEGEVFLIAETKQNAPHPIPLPEYREREEERCSD